MRIYISGGITKNPNYMEDFMEAEIKLYKRFGENVEVFNPARICEQLPQLTHGEYMDICYTLLKMSDAIAFLPNYTESVGACMEFGYSKAINLKHIFLE